MIYDEMKPHFMRTCTIHVFAVFASFCVHKKEKKAENNNKIIEWLEMCNSRSKRRSKKK